MTFATCTLLLSGVGQKIYLRSMMSFLKEAWRKAEQERDKVAGRGRNKNFYIGVPMYDDKIVFVLFILFPA